MKKLSIFTLATLLFITTSAQTLHLAWDAPTNGADGYRLYAHTNSLLNGQHLSTNVLVKVDTGTNRLVSVSNIVAGNWYFVSTSYIFSGTNKIESLPSNQVSVEIPQNPPNLRTVFLQWSGNIATTNWQDFLFLRLKIGQ